MLAKHAVAKLSGMARVDFTRVTAEDTYLRRYLRRSKIEGGQMRRDRVEYAAHYHVQMRTPGRLLISQGWLVRRYGSARWVWLTCSLLFWFQRAALLVALALRSSKLYRSLSYLSLSLRFSVLAIHSWAPTLRHLRLRVLQKCYQRPPWSHEAFSPLHWRLASMMQNSVKENHFVGTSDSLEELGPF